MKDDDGFGSGSDTPKVASLYGGPTGEPVVIEAAIEALERTLERARAGVVIGVVVVSVWKDGLSSYETAGRVGGYSVLGGLETAKADLIHTIHILEEE